MKGVNRLDVFINCPFDGAYKALFDAMVFTVIRAGLRARCALEADDAAQNRLDRILTIIGECQFGVHDISRTETAGDPPVPRFNMPLELGLFLGARRFGNSAQQTKLCIVFDREAYRFQRFISDIAGQDIHSHGGDVATLIRELASWLRLQNRALNIPGGSAIAKDYEVFRSLLGPLCARKGLTPPELSFGDYSAIVGEYVAAYATP